MFLKNLLTAVKKVDIAVQTTITAEAAANPSFWSIKERTIISIITMLIINTIINMNFSNLIPPKISKNKPKNIKKMLKGIL